MQLVPRSIDHVPLALHDQRTDQLIRRYATEAAALAFVRDVARLAGREEAARFALVQEDPEGTRSVIVQGEALVQRALQDQL